MDTDEKPENPTNLPKLYARKTKSSILVVDKGHVKNEIFKQSLMASFTYRSRSPICCSDEHEDTPKVDHSKYNKWSVSGYKSSRKIRMSCFGQKAARKRARYQDGEAKSASIHRRRSKSRSKSKKYNSKKMRNVLLLSDLEELKTNKKNTIFLEV